MRFYRSGAALIAFTFVFAAPLLYLAGVRPAAFENRPLAAAPTAGDGWNFFAELSPWATDHLPAREQAVQANAWIDYYLLGSLPRAAAETVGAAGAGGNGDPGAAPTAARVVQGRNGYLFFRPALQAACSDRLQANLRAMARLAKVVADSGRRVVFAVSPDKAAVATDSLPRLLPGKPCVADGLDEQSRVLDDFEAPGWLPLRADLQRAHDRGQQVFWKTDTHWTSVGAAQYAQKIAQALDPDVAEGIELSDTAVRRQGDLFRMVGLPFEESATGAELSTGGEVSELPGSSRFDRDREHYGLNMWRTGPGGRQIQGKSLLIGDSFTYFSLDVLRPLFTEGSFFWINKSGNRDRLIDQIEAADTVVLERVQRLVSGSSGLLKSEKFLRSLARRLGTTVPG